MNEDLTEKLTEILEEGHYKYIYNFKGEITLAIDSNAYFEITPDRVRYYVFHKEAPEVYCKDPYKVYEIANIEYECYLRDLYNSTIKKQKADKEYQEYLKLKGRIK